MSISETIRAWLHDPVLKQMEANMATLDDKITAINAAITQLSTDLNQAIADLKAAIAAGGPTTAQLSALDAIAASLGSLDTTVKSDDPGAPAAS